MRRYLLFLPVLAGIIVSEHYLWETSGKKLEVVFGSGVANDQMAEKIREGMSTGDLEGLLANDPVNLRLQIRGLMELAEKQIGTAAQFRKKRQPAAELAAQRSAAGCYWTILEKYREGYDIMDITGRLIQLIPVEDAAASRRLAGLFEGQVGEAAHAVNREPLLALLARLYNRLGDAARERACLEELVAQGRTSDPQVIIDLVKACLRMGDSERAWDLYTKRLRDLLGSNDAVYDAGLDLVEVFFREQRTEQGLGVARDLERLAVNDQRRVQVAACVLRQTVGLDRARAEALYQEFRGRLTETEWIRLLEGEAWVLGLAPATVKKYYYIDRVAPGAITIDGRLTEPCWDANSMIDFVDDDGVPLTTEAVKAWIRTDGERVYYAFHCTDPDLAHLMVQYGLTEDEVWKDDCVEIFIDTRRTYRICYQFVFNTEGRKGDYYNKNIWYECPRLERRIHIDREGGYWSIEAALYPADLEGGVCTPGTVWYGNVCKDGYLPEKPGRPTAAFFDEHYYAGVWSYTEGDNHRLQNYAYFIFR
ncbi:MAG: hypothetical protein ABIF71_03555 [Planctomycetota bacterium]